MSLYGIMYWYHPMNKKRRILVVSAQGSGVVPLSFRVSFIVDLPMIYGIF